MTAYHVVNVYDLSTAVRMKLPSSARSFIGNGAFHSTDLDQMPQIEPIHSDDLDQMPVLEPRYECILPSIVFLVSF